MKTVLIAVTLAVGLYAQAVPVAVVAVTGPPSNIKAGSTFTVQVSLSATAGSGDQAVQFSLANISWPVVATTGTAAAAAGKTLTCATVAGVLNCIVVGGVSALTDGQIATLQITLPKTAGSGTAPVSLSGLLAAVTDANGSVTGASLSASPPFTLSITSACDLNSDGTVNATDLASMVQQSLGVSACTADLNSDGKCSILDVQIAAGAAASGFCAAK
jgi:Dockerin type I domain